MAETKREPHEFNNGGELDLDSFVLPLTIFDDDHTHSDIIRYMFKDLGVRDTLDLVKTLAVEEGLENVG